MYDVPMSWQRGTTNLVSQHGLAWDHSGYQPKLGALEQIVTQGKQNNQILVSLADVLEKVLPGPQFRLEKDSM